MNSTKSLDEQPWPTRYSVRVTKVLCPHCHGLRVHGPMINGVVEVHSCLLCDGQGKVPVEQALSYVDILITVAQPLRSPAKALEYAESFRTAQRVYELAGVTPPAHWPPPSPEVRGA